jgi:hypothetical protein
MIDIETLDAKRIRLSANKMLRMFYIEWVNNYLTIGKIAEHNGITENDCYWLIEQGRRYHEDYVELQYQHAKKEGTN